MAFILKQEDGTEVYRIERIQQISVGKMGNLTDLQIPGEANPMVVVIGGIRRTFSITWLENDLADIKELVKKLILSGEFGEGYRFEFTEWGITEADFDFNGRDMVRACIRSLDIQQRAGEPAKWQCTMEIVIGEKV